jgi:hypothetical protein
MENLTYIYLHKINIGEVKWNAILISGSRVYGLHYFDATHTRITNLLRR